MVRVKKRYLCVHFQRQKKKKKNWILDDDSSLPLNDLYAEIRDLVQEFHGDFGVAAVTAGQLRILYANPLTHVCVIQVRHGAHRLVSSVLPFLTKIKEEDQKVVPRLFYTGATIRNCYKVKYLRGAFRRSRSLK